MRSINYCALAIAMVASASTAVAAPPSIVTKGNGPAAACASCHGVDGGGNEQAGFPVLAHLPQTYFTKQIADFKSGTRHNPVMTPIAKALSAEDVESVARYYASLERPKTQPATGDPAVIARGENLAVNGAWERQVPPCFKCHAVDGLGVPPVFPPIAGQHASYMVNQLQAWKTGARSNDPQKLMATVAGNLTDDDIHAVAAYLATLGTQGKKK
ncbi:MAG: c-type cytochrome [bacterium]